MDLNVLDGVGPADIEEEEEDQSARLVAPHASAQNGLNSRGMNKENEGPNSKVLLKQRKNSSVKASMIQKRKR